MTDYDENKVITKEMLKTGIKAKLVVFCRGSQFRPRHRLQNRRRLVLFRRHRGGKVFS